MQAFDALALLRRKHFLRSMAASLAEDGHCHIRGQSSILWWMFFLSIIFPVIPAASGVYSWIYSAMASVGIYGLFWLFAPQLGFAMNRKIQAEFVARMLPGEAMILAECASKDVRRLNLLLQESEAGKPILFIIRSFVPQSFPVPHRSRLMLSPEQLRDHATVYAEAQSRETAGKPRKSFFSLLSQWEAIIEQVRRELAEATELNQVITPSAEWLLDNAYIIQSHIHDIRRNMPRQYEKILPAVHNADVGPALRILNLALELVNKTDGNISSRTIHGFLSAYQDVRPLSIAELWTFPLMIRYALIEDLAFQALRVNRRQHEREWADFWANRLLSAAQRRPDRIPVMLAEISAQMPILRPHFVIHLVDQLVEEDTLYSACQTWLEGNLASSFQNVIRLEQARQLAKQIAIANDVTSLRHLSQLDWRESFEQVCHVEKILKRDAVYAGSDFATRDACRRAVEGIARFSKSEEIDIAEKALQCAAQVAEGKIGQVAFFLIDRGRRFLESLVGCRLPFSERVLRCILEHPNLVYFPAIATGTVVTLGIGLWMAARDDIGFWALFGFALAALLPASEVSIQIINYLLSLWLPPRLIPRMSFKVGIPDEYRTLVAVPAMLLTPDSIKGEVDRLEMRYIANREANLYFALLTDFADAPSETMPEDPELFAIAHQGVLDLNARYGNGKFFLFHRKREWSETGGNWIGWERKRGKLEDLNRFLNGKCRRGAEDFLKVGDEEKLRNIRFVITLDSDTKLPPESALHLIEAAAHPLNHPVISPDGRRVSEGYGVIQPRVVASLPSTMASHFSSLFANARGTDPYAQAISDIYQDLFGDSIFIGKAIYDVRVFHQVLSNRFPQQTLLSHDLIEGNYLRVGFDSTVVLFEQFPTTYQTFGQRQHRWIRGDWQITNWLFSRVPNGQYERERNPLSLVGRWKIMDNLRRSLVPPACILVLLGSWLIMPHSVVWNFFIAFAIFIPAIMPIPARVREGVKGYFFIWQDQAKEFLRALATTAILPSQAWISIDAIARTLFRLIFSRRNLLQWLSAQAVHWHSIKHRTTNHLHLYVISLATGFFSVVLAYRGFSVWFAAVPYLFLWFISPWVSYWIDRSRRTGRGHLLTQEERLYVRRIARETWRYFDDLVGPQSHWLPPDNSQERLHVEVAYRTSPTNIGLWLLSALAAHDLGFLTVDQLANRLLASMESIGRLEKSRGHLLNWYDIQTLEPLRPQYISTVDSGNLLASLMTLDQGLIELQSRPIISPDILDGLADTIAAFETLCTQKGSLSSSAKMAILDLAQLCIPESQSIKTLWERSRIIAVTANQALDDLLKECPSWSKDPETVQEFAYWIKKIAEGVENLASVMNRYFGWVPLLLDAPASALHTIQSRGLAHTLLDPMHHTLVQLASSENANALSSLMRALDGQGADVSEWINGLREEITQVQNSAGETLRKIQLILDQSRQLQEQMPLNDLYDVDKKLFAIGRQAGEGAQNSSYYDLLASEARLTSLIAIARGEVEPGHWQTLSRPFGLFSGHKLLYSWSGSMFEYLMPLIFTRSFEHSVLHHACNEAVSIQIDYGRSRKVPWGISESAFGALDAHRIYQYRAFGVPALGLKRDLDKDLVVAPYATALALMVYPHAAIQNLKTLARLGFLGSKGFYEAADYSREDTEGKRGVIVYAHMAHHQGMSLLSMDNLLRDGVMQERFHKDLRVRAVEPLLYEGVPPSREVSYLRITQERSPARLIAAAEEVIPERFCNEKTAAPRIQLFSNGSYSCMVTNSGGGYSRWREYDLTRWRADPTRDSWGAYCYVRDLNTGKFWSTTHHPTCRHDPDYRVTSHLERAEFKSICEGIEAVTEIAVSAQEDVEVRRVTLVNRSARKRSLDVTTYAEMALAPHANDRAHPAYSKLFIRTEAIPDKEALIAWRSSELHKDSAIWVGHLLASDFHSSMEFETSRALFIGRGRSLKSPKAMTGHLSNLAGFVLDPIFSIRKELVLEPGEKARLAFILLAAESRDQAVQLMDRYRDIAAADRVLEFAWMHAQLGLRFIRIQTEDALFFQELAGRMLYPDAGFRASEGRLRRNRLGQSQLWAFGISGDLPICTVKISDPLYLRTVREVLQAHTFWHERGLKSDLVILNSEAAGYDQPLQQQLLKLIQIYSLHTGVDQPGGVFLRSAEQLSEEERTLLLSAAHIVISASRGSLSRQMSTPPKERWYPALLQPTKTPIRDINLPTVPQELVEDNGIGGFTPDGREYVIRLRDDTTTPAPWINVLANPNFGSLVDETGQGFAWYRNSQMNRLTPWHNDPVQGDASSGIYLRDEETGEFWTASASPVRGSELCEIRHGQGYTKITRRSHGVDHELLVFVPVSNDADDPVRIQRLRIANPTARQRRLTATFYAEWVLGKDREETQLHIVTGWDSVSQALLAHNAYNTEFSSGIAFASSSMAAVAHTTDRTEFLGRNGSAENPAALGRSSLSGRTGTGLDPCAALQVRIDLNPGQTTDLAFLLGQADSMQEVRSVIAKYADIEQIDAAFKETKHWWERLLGTLQVHTPDQTMDFMVNRWLIYQTLSCRIWARSALYQSGGAYGFRDQLQDVLALVYAKPDLVREHILRAAGRQFLEGDVQHWWHPQSGAGIRTRCSDDLLWLPYVTAHYVETTGDREILEQRIPFLEGHPLEESEQEAYSIPSISMTDGTLFEHCSRAIEKGFRLGVHDLPLIGLCDWNDGFNRVGTEGKGESIWLAWFLIDVLRGFSQLCLLRNNQDLANSCMSRIHALESALDLHGWDGEWYRRAYFDDGSLLGSRRNSECRIDSVSQSWAAIAGNPSTEHVRQALLAVDRYLIRKSDKMILLFTPPIQQFEPNPGYIKSYPSGVRENGGQYTQAALWVALAFLRKGDGKKAVECLRMLNPIEHAKSPADVVRYQTEPYVMAADVYSLERNIGRGGWTWYTGSSAWMYRIWVEEVLGFRLRGDMLSIRPTIPADWPGFSLKYRYGDTTYQVTVVNPTHVGHSIEWVELDGSWQSDQEIRLRDDGYEHTIQIKMGYKNSDSELLMGQAGGL